MNRTTTSRMRNLFYKVSQFALCATIGTSLLLGSCQTFAAADDYLDEDGNVVTQGTAGDDYITTDPAGGANFDDIDLMGGSDTFVLGSNASIPFGNIGTQAVLFTTPVGGNSHAYIYGQIYATDTNQRGIQDDGNGDLSVTVGTAGVIDAYSYGIYINNNGNLYLENNGLMSLTGNGRKSLAFRRRL